MRHAFYLLALGVCANALISASASAQAAPEVTVTRLDCGTPNPPTEVSQRFTDIYAYAGVKVPLPELLGKLELKPEQIKYVGISHYHGDHIGQVASLPKRTLLIGKGDWDVLVDANAVKVAGTDNANFAHRISGGGKVEPVRLDKDLFGDGTVVMLNTPGHTPGHHVLLVKLKDMGPVILSGDMAHFRENYDFEGVPNFNTDGSQTIASIERVKQIA
jgi:N-acyl homoserine lactone hydrolase